jgi:predicted naringenin-chalcone synthase
LADIISIATSSPVYAHKQEDILQYMQKAYQLDAEENRKLAFLYHHSGIETRHSAIPDYGSNVNDLKFFHVVSYCFCNFFAIKKGL